MALALVQTLSMECTSLVACKLNKNCEIDSLNYQSHLMTSTFIQFPSVVLLLRTHNCKGKALYAFIVDGPDVKVDRDIMKVIHFAIPKDESAEGLAQMYTTFKEFSPDWPKIKTVLVDPHFRGTAALSKAFPSVQIVLSLFYICRSIQQELLKLSLDTHVERLLLGIIKDTMCSATESSLKYLYDTLKNLLIPRCFVQLNAHWLLTDHLWDINGWRGLSESTQYFQGLEAITQDFSQMFTSGVSLESSITSLAKHIRDCRLTMKPPDPVRDVVVFRMPGNPAACVSPLQKEPWGNGSHLPPCLAVQFAERTLLPKQDEKSVATVNLEVEDQIRQSLALVCTVPAAKLCLKELAVARKSVQMVNASDDTLSIQIIEDAHLVSRNGPHLCTCHFSETFQLPCRHILAALKGNSKVLQCEMVSEKWLKKSKPCDEEPFGSGLLELLQSSWCASEEKSFTVQFLTDDLMRLLAECSNEEFERRYNTLRELADSWIGPYEQVKL